MAVTFECRIRHLFPKFLANTFVLFGALKSAGTVAACSLQAFADGVYNFLIFI